MKTGVIFILPHTQGCGRYSHHSRYESVVQIQELKSGRQSGASRGLKELEILRMGLEVTAQAFRLKACIDSTKLQPQSPTYSRGGWSATLGGASGLSHANCEILSINLGLFGLVHLFA
jgi:hypothetical protein